MRRTDIEAVGDVAGEALAAGGALVRGMHEGIARRPFAILGAAAAPVRVVHDGVAGAVYGGVGGALRAAARAGAAVAARGAGDAAPALAEGPRSSLALAALNGLYGDHLDARGNALALGMGFRRRGTDVDATAAGLATAFPDATSRLAVFVHGLGETDAAWRLAPRRGADRTAGARTASACRTSSASRRCTSATTPACASRATAASSPACSTTLVAGWPGGVEELVLVGHSMGGLVARSACHYGDVDGRRWTARRAPRLLPRHAAPRRRPREGRQRPRLGARPAARDQALGRRAQRAQRRHQGPALRRVRRGGLERLRGSRRVPARPLPGGPVPPRRPLLLRRRDAARGARRAPCSATCSSACPSSSGRGNGRGRSIPFEVENGRELTGLTHFDLLNHPAVYEQLRAWITRSPQRRALPVGPPATALAGGPT